MLIWVFLMFCLTLISYASAAPLEQINSFDAPAQNETDFSHNSSAFVQFSANETFVGDSVGAKTDNIETSSNGNNVIGSHVDSEIYAGILSQEALQQYIEQLGVYTPQLAYPSPIGYGHHQQSLYSNPIIVQTGYEGFLVPSVLSPPTLTVSQVDSSQTSSLNTNLFKSFSSLFSSLMMSSLFRVMTAIISAIGLVFFGSTIINMVCNMTSICANSVYVARILNKEVTAEGDEKPINEHITSERIRRTIDFVGNAISKYEKLQQILEKTGKKYKH